MGSASGRICPFDHTPMAAREGLPAWLDINRMIGQHPMPFLGNYVKTRLDEASRTVMQHVSWASCPTCGFVAIFEK